MIPTQRTKRTLFWVGLSLPMVALVAMTWLVHQSSGHFNNSFNWVMHTYKVMNVFEQTQGHVVEAEANQRSYLLTGRNEYLEPYQRAMQFIQDDMMALKSLTSKDRGQQANIALLENTIASELIFDPAKAFPNGIPPTNAPIITLTEQGRKKLETIRHILFEAREEQQQALSRHQQDAEADVVASQIMSLVLIVSVALALIFVVVILLRLEKLQQFVTICAWTGQVKFQGQWLRLDEYLKRQFGIAVSHSLSQEAAEKMKHDLEALSFEGQQLPAEKINTPR